MKEVKMRLKYFLYLFLILFVVSCSTPEVRQLQSVEVREYEGEKLGSFDDFRENSIKGVQSIDTDNYSLKITGLVENELDLSYEQVLEKQGYQKIVTLYCVEGWDVNILWEGILLKELFDEVQVKPEANTVIFYAYDGYSTSLSLEYILNNDIMIAYKMNNITLPAANGFPFQLVAEDKWGYKWIRWLTKIEISDNPDYKGTWERAGYNNKGDLNGSKFEV